MKEHHIPFTIATASGRENVDFFFEQLNLSDWFSPDKVVYDDGTVKGKPNPDLYIKAMKLLNRSATEIVIFEDAVAGIQAARNAAAGKVIIVNSNQDDYSAFPSYSIIQHFDEVDRRLFI
ncbi:MAG: HAD family hydrolase [Tannerellaceae bacterium]|nr:HAD family hydrolase [Tannerellaceae bacterium]